MVHPSRDIRKAVQDFLGDTFGAHAVTYASFFEQTMLMVAMSKRKEIPVEDLVSLANLTKETFIDGEVMQAVQDIGFCLDHIKHRYKSSEQLRNYVADLLKMAPDLSRMGVYDSTIEGPLRKAMKASQHREFNETQEIIEERIQESRMRSILHQIAADVKEIIKSRPSMKIEELSENDRLLSQDQHSLVESVTSLLLAGKRAEAIETMLVYQIDFVDAYQADLSQRAKNGDLSAAFTYYIMVMILVKLASYMVPMTAEDVYQKNFRHMEGDPSIHVVMWPESVIVYILNVVGQTSDIPMLTN
jgi:isoleucyl-tRNA synthetase